MEIVEAPLQIRPGFDVRYWKEIVLPRDSDKIFFRFYRRSKGQEIFF